MLGRGARGDALGQGSCAPGVREVDKGEMMVGDKEQAGGLDT